MDLGDIILFEGETSLVVRVEETGYVHIMSSSGTVRGIPSDLDLTDPAKCLVRYNPYRSWPFVTLSKKPKGKLLSVALPDLDGGLHWLTLFEDWIVGEPLRNGGALYLRPTLGLRYPDRVFVQFEQMQTSVVIPRHFTSVGRRGSDAKFSRAKAVIDDLTVYDHLLGDTLGEDE